MNDINDLFTVLSVNDKLPDDLARRIDAWMEDPRNIGALARALKARDLSKFDPDKPLDTGAGRRMKRRR